MTDSKNRCPTPTRMELAREFRGVGLEQMCADLHIEPRAYEKWEEVKEDGSEGVYDYDIAPSEDLMREVALYLAFPFEWFYADEIELTPSNRFSPISGSQLLDLEIEKAVRSAT